MERKKRSCKTMSYLKTNVENNTKELVRIEEDKLHSQRERTWNTWGISLAVIVQISVFLVLLAAGLTYSLRVDGVIAIAIEWGTLFFSGVYLIYFIIEMSKSVVFTLNPKISRLKDEQENFVNDPSFNRRLVKLSLNKENKLMKEDLQKEKLNDLQDKWLALSDAPFIGKKAQKKYAYYSSGKENLFKKIKVKFKRFTLPYLLANANELSGVGVFGFSRKSKGARIEHSFVDKVRSTIVKLFTSGITALSINTLIVQWEHIQMALPKLVIYGGVALVSGLVGFFVRLRTYSNVYLDTMQEKVSIIRKIKHTEEV